VASPLIPPFGPREWPKPPPGPGARPGYPPGREGSSGERPLPRSNPHTLYPLPPPRRKVGGFTGVILSGGLDLRDGSPRQFIPLGVTTG